MTQQHVAALDGGAIIRGFQYAQTCAVLIILAVTVTLIDLLSATVRKRFI